MLLLAVISTAIDPCRLITADDVTRLTGWTTNAPASQKRYHMPQESGTTCSLSAAEGVVTVPDAGSLTGSGVFANPLANGGAIAVHIHNGYAEIFNGSVYVDKHHRHAVIKILPLADQATQAELTAAAEIVAGRLP